MQVKILADASYRISSALSQQFKRGMVLSLPRKTCENLIERGVAEAVKKPSKTGD